MAGPLGTLGPSTDPLWADNTPGWTNQGNTGAVESSGVLGTPGGVVPGVLPANSGSNPYSTPAVNLGNAVKNVNGLTALVQLGTIGTGAASTVKDAAGTTSQSATSATGQTWLVPAGGTITIAAATLSAWTWTLLNP